MKILFSFESKNMPLRAATIIKWFRSKNHIVDVLYDEYVSHEKIESPHFLDGFQIMNTVSDFNEYDVWFADILNYKNYGELSYYNSEMEFYKNKLCIISFDDGPEYFNHRLSPTVHEKVYCWVNNIIFKDREKYIKPIQEKNMLMPTYIETSNNNYFHFKNNNIKILDFLEKESRVYFSGAITGCIPSFDCRINSIMHVVDSSVPHFIRVHGSDPNIILSELYKLFIGDDLKSPLVPYDEFLNEMNLNKFILSPKGNCQPLRRQYEGFVFNNLLFINENNTVDYLCEGKPDHHFVSYKLDCSDLKEKLKYYYYNLEDAKVIADNGTKFWHENCRIYDDGSLSEYMNNYLVENFKKYGITI